MANLKLILKEVARNQIKNSLQIRKDKILKILKENRA
jgi:hypothetical protein